MIAKCSILIELIDSQDATRYKGYRFPSEDLMVVFHPEQKIEYDEQSTSANLSVFNLRENVI